MKAVAIIQARMSSTRLPGKVIAPIAGMPSIALMVARLQRSRSIDSIVVATSVDRSDDAFVTVLEQHGIAYFRGSLDDVLSRFCLVAAQQSGDVFVRLTGDCPLIDPDIVDAAIALLNDGGFDYVSNGAPPTYPDGLDVEAFTRHALECAERVAVLRSDREHVTIAMRRAETGLKQGLLRSAIDLSHLRWTVDYPDDLDHVRRLAEAPGIDCLTADRFDFLRAIDRHPEIEVVPRYERNEGLKKSLAQDAAMSAL